MNLTLESKKCENEYRQQESEVRDLYENVAYRQSMIELGIEFV